LAIYQYFIDAGTTKDVVEICKYIKNSSEKSQLDTVKQDVRVIKLIKNPLEKVKLTG